MGLVFAFLILLVVIGIPLLLGKVTFFVALSLSPAFLVYIATRVYGFYKGWEKEHRKTKAVLVAVLSYFGLLLAIGGICLVVEIFGEKGSGVEFLKNTGFFIGRIVVIAAMFITLSYIPLWFGYICGVGLKKTIEERERRSSVIKIKLPFLSDEVNNGTVAQLRWGIVGAVSLLLILLFAFPMASVILQMPLEELVGISGIDSIEVTILSAFRNLFLFNVAGFFILMKGDCSPTCSEEITESLAEIICLPITLVFGRAK